MTRRNYLERKRGDVYFAANEYQKVTFNSCDMSEFVHLELLPLGKVLRVKRGTPLHDVLFAHGVEFPCGGRGLCKGCRVKVLAGVLPITDEDRQKLSSAEMAEGWRLACRGRAESDLKIDLAQWRRRFSRTSRFSRSRLGKGWA